MKAVNLREINIHCDTCHHEFEGNPQEWLNKNCPECGAIDIINDDDMKAHENMMRFVDAVNKLCGDVSADSKFIDITVITASLRNKNTTNNG